MRKKKAVVTKEVIIRYKDSKTLEVLKIIGKYVGFSITETEEQSPRHKKKTSFTILSANTQGYRFNRDEANER